MDTIEIANTVVPSAQRQRIRDTRFVEGQKGALVARKDYHTRGVGYNSGGYDKSDSNYAYRQKQERELAERDMRDELTDIMDALLHGTFEEDFPAAPQSSMRPPVSSISLNGESQGSSRLKKGILHPNPQSGSQSDPNESVPLTRRERAEMYQEINERTFGRDRNWNPKPPRTVPPWRITPRRSPKEDQKAA